MTDIEEKLKKLDAGKLMDVVKNYRQYGYDEKLRTLALSILEERGITKEQLALTGSLKNTTYDFADDLYRLFGKNSKVAFILYGVVLLTSILSPILFKTDTFGFFVVILKFTAYILYVIFLVKSFINQSQFYKAIGQDYGAEGALVYFFIGMPFYIFMYFFFRKQMKEKMTVIK
ncbi:MAG: hypothetical protein LBG77_00575 [Dysgonamonadaceae bacterium]|jgi:hypothetical protein|nr:hypothetical protein [Dysgonamonadaceae bacterium]